MNYNQNIKNIKNISNRMNISNSNKTTHKEIKNKDNVQLNLYVICEGTSCEFIQKYHKNVFEKSSALSDYGLIESYYFNNNPKNTSLFNDSNSIYLVSTKNSSIESSFIIYGNQNNRTVYPIPYITNSNFIQNKGDLRKIKEEFGSNQNVNNYLGQNKFGIFSEYLPTSNVLLNWEYESDKISNYYKMDLNKFFELIRKIKYKNPHIENIFVVSEAPFIASLINNVSKNKLSSKDVIEHSSMWLFKYKSSTGRFWGVINSIKSRNKLYPLGRNHGRLQTFNNSYYYYYKDLRIPVFHYNKPIPTTYINPKYLTLCKIVKNMSNSKKSVVNIERKDTLNRTGIQSELEKLKKNRPVS